MYLGNVTESALFPEICRKDGLLNKGEVDFDNTENRE